MLLHGALVQLRGSLEIVAAVFQPGVADQSGQVVGVQIERFLVLDLGLVEVPFALMNLGHGDEHGRAAACRSADRWELAG